MRLTNGNYEAFARPQKPKDVDGKDAYIVGSGLAGLATAVFLIRDAQMDGSKIRILEEQEITGGALDGATVPILPHDGFVMRGGRELESHYECLWDLFRTIPSLEIEDASVLDEFYWLNLEDPNSSNCRLIYNRGDRVENDGKFAISQKGQKEIVEMFMSTEEGLAGKRIDDVFTDEVFNSNFWLYWRSMFAFENWHSAIEMRRYLHRFIHAIKGLPDFSALKFTRYNQYESFVKPIMAYLKEHGVEVEYGTKVEDILVNITGTTKTAEKIIITQNGTTEEIPLTENDLVFVTNGSITESSTQGDNNTPAPITHDLGGSWKLWQSLAKQSPEFGNPDTFCATIPPESWFVSATITCQNDDLAPYFERLTNRQIHTGKVVTGGIITVTDSNWLLSFTIHRQPQFKDQTDAQTVIWAYGLLSNTPGNYVKKPIEECSGAEIAKEMMYHLGVPEDMIDNMAENSCTTIPVYLPYITSYFMLRAEGDRPLIVPNGSTNLAFIGNFAETPVDTVFTTEYSVRTAMEAVYQLLDVQRGVPEVFASAYDVRCLANAAYYLTDEKKISQMGLPFIQQSMVDHFIDKNKDTFIGEILKDNNLI